MQAIVLRTAAAADAAAIGEFQTRCWNDTYRGIVPDDYLDSTTAEDRADRWRRRIVSGERRVTVALQGDHLVGVASTSTTPLGPSELPPLELVSLYVDRAVHGTGVAQDLLLEAVGCAPAHLWAFVGNKRAESFYLKSGFRPTDEVRLDQGTGIEERRWIRPTRP